MHERSFKTERKDHLLRQRVIALLADAAKRPLSIVIAGAGYGKTSAVSDFVRNSAVPFTWLQFSELDNAGSRFWAKFVQIFAGWDEEFVEMCESLGFPDTEDKINQRIAIRNKYAPKERRLVVLDDVHLINHPDILRFLERGFREVLKNISVILICREMPNIDFTSMQIRGLVPTITEDDLCFTESELRHFLNQQGLSLPEQSLSNIMKDTKGWAFSVNLAARSLKKSPGYEGYVSVAIKRNIFKLMQTEAYDAIGDKTRRLLVRLSLIDHLSAELVADIAAGDAELLADFKKQNAFIRFDGNINAYIIHHLFLEFLRSKQEILTDDEYYKTFRAAAGWCAQNGFEIDALGYYEKIGDYGAIVAILKGFPVQMSYDIAELAVKIFERAPKALPERVDSYAVMYVRILIRLGRWEEAFALMREYERRFLRFPEDDPFRNRALGIMYYAWGNLRTLMSTVDDRYDFACYYAKMDECMTKAHVEPDQYADLPIGFWLSLVGSSRQGAPQEYINAHALTVRHVSHCWRGAASGLDILDMGELKFFQGDIKAAEPLVASALRIARDHLLFEVEQKALFYQMRMALAQGDHIKAEKALGEMAMRLEEKNYAHRYFNYDAALGMFYCGLRRPDLVAVWLREKFAAYKHAYYIENTGNQIKARAHYLTRNFQPLLSYIEELRWRESVLYGRVEMYSLEACVYLQMKENDAALGALRRAYEEAAPNGIVMPFVELGRDMRTLASAAMREPDPGIPAEWLGMIKRRAASFAKLQSMMISEYEKANGRGSRAVLSPRESKILKDLYFGLSRSEIAEKQSLSVNTVNSAINSIFNKLGARNTVDAVRIAAEEKLV